MRSPNHWVLHGLQRRTLTTLPASNIAPWLLLHCRPICYGMIVCPSSSLVLFSSDLLMPALQLYESGTVREPSINGIKLFDHKWLLLAFAHSEVRNAVEWQYPPVKQIPRKKWIEEKKDERPSTSNFLSGHADCFWVWHGAYSYWWARDLVKTP